MPPLDEAFAKAFGIESGKVDGPARRGRSAICKLELKRKVEASAEGPGAARVCAKRRRSRCRKCAGRHRGAGPGGADGGQPARAGHEGRGHQARRRTCSGRRRRSASRSASSSASSSARRTCRRSPSRCTALVEEIAQTYEQPEAVVRWHYEKRERLAEFEALAVEQNVVDWVLARAKVTRRPDDVRRADDACRRTPRPDDGASAIAVRVRRSRRCRSH